MFTMRYGLNMYVHVHGFQTLHSAAQPFPHPHRGTCKIIFSTQNENETKQAAGHAWILLQYCQLPDKNSSNISRDICNFSWHFDIIYFATSRGIPDDVVQKPGWETLLSRDDWHGSVV
jgi:hypothetical protein